MSDQPVSKGQGLKLTKKQIAQACGVSRMTLDRVLNNRPGVSDETRAKILSFLQQTGYRENRLARSLVQGRSHSFGIIVFSLSNSFHAHLVNAFQRVAQEAGYVSYIMLSNKDPQREKELLEDLLARQVDGIVIHSVVKEAGYGAYLRNQGTPILAVMNRVSSGVPFLGFDEQESMRSLVLFALSKGYRRFFYICPPLALANVSNIDSLERRKRGFDAGLASCAGAEAVILDGPDFLSRLMEADLSRGARVCILCTSDIYAVEIHSALAETGLQAPRDYAIAGYDNIPMLHSFRPRLTTVSLHINELGAKAAQLLIGAASGQHLAEEEWMASSLMRMDTL